MQIQSSFKRTRVFLEVQMCEFDYFLLDPTCENRKPELTRHYLKVIFIYIYFNYWLLMTKPETSNLMHPFTFFRSCMSRHAGPLVVLMLKMELGQV